jgi:cell division protein FtsQ
MRSLDADPPRSAIEGSIGGSGGSTEVPEAAAPEQVGVSEPAGPAVIRVDEARRRSLRRWAIAAGTITAIAVIGATLTSTPLFDAKAIEVVGEDRLTEARVMRIAGVNQDTGVFRLDESEVARRLERDPWIAHAQVATSLPSSIRIEITERTPVAVAGTDEGVLMIAADGVALTPPPKGARYPVLVQVGSIRDPASATRAATSAVAAMDVTIRAEVRTVVVDRRGLLRLHMRDGMAVVYGSATELEAKGQALRAILRWAQGQPRVLRSIDLTVPGAPTARFEGVEAQTVAPPSAWPSSAEPDLTDLTPSPTP